MNEENRKENNKDVGINEKETIKIIPKEEIKDTRQSENKNQETEKGLNRILKYTPEISETISKKGHARYTIASIRNLSEEYNDSNEIITKKLNDLVNDKRIKVEIDEQNKDVMVFRFIEGFKTIISDDRRAEIRQKEINIVKNSKQFHSGYIGKPRDDPVAIPPLGYDKEHHYRKLFPIIHLPFQPVETISFGYKDIYPNRLIWGDNLHVMRQLPNESIDFIYIDPPFFSNREYTEIWGDDNEIRSFVDMWDGGLWDEEQKTGYLPWLDARLFEMKRLLKPTGSICVHLDWHAAHYVKVEMDKIFGYGGKDKPGFKNEIIWSYRTGGATKKYFSRKHDNILFYTKSGNYTFNSIKERIYYDKPFFNPNVDEQGRYYADVLPVDVWEIPAVINVSKERIGYPTQKPEDLLEKLIKALTNPGDIFADFFLGGGTSIYVAQRLKRRWIGCDISRIAIAVARDRLLGLKLLETPDIVLEYWGSYEINKFNNLEDDEFKEFIIMAYDAIPSPKEEIAEGIHAYKNNVPIFIGNKSMGNPITHDIVNLFVNTLIRYSKKKGTIIAWDFTPQARDAIGLIKNNKEININTVEISLVPINSKDFSSHISEKSHRYSDILTFIYEPDIKLKYSRIAPLNFRFDIRETVSKNGSILNVQWDFHYNGTFKSSPEYTFTGQKKKLPDRIVDYQFDYPGNRKIACKVQDCKGGESMKVIDIKVG